jgi:hypothetical protein
MPTGHPTPTKGFPSIAAGVRALHKQSLSPREIAHVLEAPLPQVRHAIARMKYGNGTRKWHQINICLGLVAFKALEPHATKRGITVALLVKRIATAVAADDLVDATLDDL